MRIGLPVQLHELDHERFQVVHVDAAALLCELRSLKLLIESADPRAVRLDGLLMLSDELNVRPHLVAHFSNLVLTAGLQLGKLEQSPLVGFSRGNLIPQTRALCLGLVCSRPALRERILRLFAVRREFTHQARVPLRRSLFTRTKFARVRFGGCPARLFQISARRLLVLQLALEAFLLERVLRCLRLERRDLIHQALRARPLAAHAVLGLGQLALKCTDPRPLP